MGAIGAEWRTIVGALSLHPVGVSGLRITFPATLVPAFWLWAGWVGGPGTARMLIPAVGGPSLEKGKLARGARGGPVPTPEPSGSGSPAQCRKQAAP